ncbi:hypothetical protein Dsin_023500 [Dipteronia sinensis]|uniref:Uncharacterized protein n=1 Tax=Dipteronia sinensis TaxID=43782 RepID=A0AAE0A3G8_9ROSI|nr:hypothetical protein Dsin_023500 [Dipteronia sinensis]
MTLNLGLRGRTLSPEIDLRYEMRGRTVSSGIDQRSGMKGGTLPPGMDWRCEMRGGTLSPALGSTVRASNEEGLCPGGTPGRVLSDDGWAVTGGGPC